MPPKFIFFDCDNTLVLSEDLAVEGCADLVNQILATKGVPERFTPETLIANFIGHTFRSIIVSLQQQYGFSLAPEELKAYVKMEEERVIAQFTEQGRPTDGSLEVFERLQHDSRYTLAVVSSSAIGRIRASLAKTGHDNFLDPNHVFSAASSLPCPTAKPNPAIYLYAMERLGAGPKECVAIEDSISGCRAAVQAGIPTIGYVGAYHTDMKRCEMMERLIDAGCQGILWDWSEFEDTLAEMERCYA
ncbi:HAD-like domain-containing protein [Exophiala viscosa]|uniref:HAD-like domain-containing protein n=1 Tax=Exophiala viscosa TaxID=2486360 RepID=A0AAN6DUJ5_9EURO|nr:HAD-like domain-containing protein [Exophiala viscosa]KAI1623249.1 HAD-like domain-containing protein [Exophiala viscosa]